MQGPTGAAGQECGPERLAENAGKQLAFGDGEGEGAGTAAATARPMLSCPCNTRHITDCSHRGGVHEGSTEALRLQPSQRGLAASTNIKVPGYPSAGAAVR